MLVNQILNQINRLLIIILANLIFLMRNNLKVLQVSYFYEKFNLEKMYNSYELAVFLNICNI